MDSSPDFEHMHLESSQMPRHTTATRNRALRVYLKLGPSRSLDQVAEKLGIARRTVQRWSVDMDWKRRARLHDGKHQPTRAAPASDAERDAIDARIRAWVGGYCVPEWSEFIKLHPLPHDPFLHAKEAGELLVHQVRMRDPEVRAKHEERQAAWRAAHSAEPDIADLMR